MFMDSEGRYVTAGQWHDQKFKAFTDPWMYQLQAPKTMILGGMEEDGEDDPVNQEVEPKSEPSPIAAKAQLASVSVQA